MRRRTLNLWRAMLNLPYDIWHRQHRRHKQQSYRWWGAFRRLGRGLHR